MANMYNTIEQLCNEKGIKPGRMCADLEISRGVIGDLKAGRTKKLSAENLEKISEYFKVSVDYLLNGEDTEKASTLEDGCEVEGLSDIYFSLAKDLQDARIDPEDIRNFARIIAKNMQKE